MQTFRQLMRKVKVSEVWSHRLGFLWICQKHASPPLSTCGTSTSVTYPYQGNLAGMPFSKGKRREENLFRHTAVLAECYFKCYTSSSSYCLWFKLSVASILDMESMGSWGALASAKQTVKPAGRSNSAISFISLFLGLQKSFHIAPWQLQHVVMLQILLLNTQDVFYTKPNHTTFLTKQHFIPRVLSTICNYAYSNLYISIQTILSLLLQFQILF